MDVKELIDILQGLPPNMEVMVPAECDVDRVVSVYVAKVAKTKRNWPAGNFRVLVEKLERMGGGEQTTGDPFEVVIIDLWISDEESLARTRAAHGAKARQ